MYCHLSPPDAMPCSANLKFLGAPRHQRPNFDGCIYIHYAAPLHSARISSIYFLDKAWFCPVCWPPCATPGNEACRKKNLRRVGENSCPTLSRLWTKVREILGHCRGLAVRSTNLQMTNCPLIWRGQGHVTNFIISHPMKYLWNG